MFDAPKNTAENHKGDELIQVSKLSDDERETVVSSGHDDDMQNNAAENHTGDVYTTNYDERETVVSSGHNDDAQNATDNQDLFARHDHSNHELVPNEDAHVLSSIPLEKSQASLKVEVEHGSSLYMKTDDPVESEGILTTQDIDTIRLLDKEYDLSLIEREIGWNARYISVRQNSGLTLWVMCLLILIGTIVFQFTTTWSVTDSILFCVYTITTVGYGNNDVPVDNPGLLMFISGFIFLGIANLTIMGAQIYQWIKLEATRIQYDKDKQEFKKRLENVQKVSEDLDLVMNGEAPLAKMDLDSPAQKTWRKSIQERTVSLVQFVQKYLLHSPYGELLVVMLPFFLMIMLGALVVGLVEGWAFSEAFYFAVISMTTVGFGDLVPDKLVSKWFCIFWLPFSVGFLSLYLSSIARFYIHFSSKSVEKVELRIRKRLYLHRAMQEKEREEAMERVASGGFGVQVEDEDEDGEISYGIELMKETPPHIKHPERKNIFAGFATVPTNDQSEPDLDLSLAETKDRHRRRNEILSNSGYAEESFTSMKTMKDVIVAVKLNMVSDRRFSLSAVNNGGIEKLQLSPYPERKDRLSSDPTIDTLSLNSKMHYSTAGGIEKKPSFALRVLVQERLAAIIAYEIAGYQSRVSIKDNTLSVTIDSLKYTSEKWMIPRRAMKAFRAVAFEALYYVGERDLVLFGPDALFNLKPVELQRLFGPLLAALGDADTMEMWLYSTNNLVSTEFIKVGAASERDKDEIAQKGQETQLGANITANLNTTTNEIDDATLNQEFTIV